VKLDELAPAPVGAIRLHGGRRRGKRQKFLLRFVLEKIQVGIFLVELPDLLLVVEIMDVLFVAVAHLHEVTRQLAGLGRPFAEETFEIATVPPN